MKRIINILLLLLLVQTFTFAQGVGVDSVQVVNALADSVADNTIKDTIVLKYSRGIVPFETIAREGTKYYAVTSDGHKEEITSFINGRKRVMVKDGDGHELVIDKDGNVMGVEEYKACGGSKVLLRENIKEKDSQVTRSGNVKFLSAGDYLFDTYDNYSGKTGYAERFPSIGEGDYKPAYACVESNTKLEIKAEPYANITFKNERGVPVLCKDGILEVTARGDRDTTSIYAYDAENHIVGKVNVLSYDKVTRKICLVPIGDTKATDAVETKQGLDEIFAKLMVDFDVTIGEPIAIQYAKDNIFTHGGSDMIGVYNTDQKAAINKLKERGIDNETVYLFFVNDCKALKANDSPDVVNGYMPRGYQFGFIYNELNNYRTIAHEICHGAFLLKHTFDATDYLDAECTTDNLMDYNDGKTLNHWQWKDIHQPKSVRFKWLQEEEGAEAWGEIGTKILCINDESVVATIRKYRYFYLPDGRIVDLEKYTPSGFYTEEDVTPNVRGALATIRINGYDQSTIFKTDENTKEHTVTSWGYKIGDAQAMKVLDVSKVLVENPAGIDAVRVFVSKEEVRIEQNGVVVEILQLSNDCNCTYKQVESECDALLEKYANSPIMQNHDLRTAILKDPCILNGPMIHFATIPPTESEWMKEFNLVFGTMANLAFAPIEIQIAVSMIGEEAGAELMKFIAKQVYKRYGKEGLKMLLKDKMSDFSKGFTISLGADMFAGLVLDKLGVDPITPTSVKEWMLDACVEGIKEAFMPKGGEYHKHASAGVECLVGVDVFETIENIESEKPIDDIIVETFIDCSVSALIDALVNADKVSNAINKLRNAGTDKIIAALRKLSFISPEDEITFLSKVCKVHDEYWMNKMQSVLRTEGIAGFDFLKDISFDYTKLSIKNFERLSRIVSKAKASPEAIEMFKNLLSQGRDANRIIKHIDDMGCSVDEYTTIISKLLGSNEFKKTITIKGKTMNIKEFFLNDNMDAVSWYYKRDNNYLTYYKVWEGENKECLEITFEIVDGTIKNVTKEISVKKIVEIKDVVKEIIGAIEDEAKNN